MLKQKIIKGIAAIFCLGLVLYSGWPLVETAHAQLGGPTLTNSNDVLNWVNIVVSITLEFLSIIAWVALNLLSKLLDPTFIESVNQVTERGGSPLLLEVWRFSRDIMNVIFAFMLVFAALYTVVTANQEFIKENIRNFILAVILVNFSWFFPRVILDVSNILTATIFAIPSSVGAECSTVDSQGNPAPCKYAKQIYFDFNGTNTNMPDACRTSGISGGDLRDPNTTTYISPVSEVCIEIAPLPANADTGLAMLHGLYMNHVRLVGIAKIIPSGPGLDSQFRELSQFILQLLFAVVYLMAATIPLVAMTVVFAMRIPIIWLTTAFMPFMFVGFVLKDKMGSFDTQKLIFGHFIKAAFLPTVVAIPLSIGYIMIGAVMQAPCPEESSFADLCTKQGILLDGIFTSWDLLWSILALIIMWVGFFMVLQIDDLYNNVGQSFKSFGQSWGSFLLKSPLAMPVFGANGRGVSPLTAARVAKNPERAFFPTGTFNLDALSKRLGAGGAINADNPEGIRSVAQQARSQTNVDVKQNIEAFIRSDGREKIEEVRNYLRNNDVDLSENSTKAFLREFDSNLGHNEQKLQQLATMLAPNPSAPTGNENDSNDS